MVAPFCTFYGKIWAGVSLNTGKRFFLEVLFQNQQKKYKNKKKTVLGIIFKLDIRLRDWYVFLWQSQKFWTFPIT